MIRPVWYQVIRLHNYLIGRSDVSPGSYQRFRHR
jgi:hypothetical protein